MLESMVLVYPNGCVITLRIQKTRKKSILEDE